MDDGLMTGLANPCPDCIFSTLQCQAARLFLAIGTRHNRDVLKFPLREKFCCLIDHDQPNPSATVKRDHLPFDGPSDDYRGLYRLVW